MERSRTPSLPKGEELNWTPIGQVNGGGNSSTIHNYEFIDSSSEGGGWGEALYYRLKQTDYDGKYEYFGPVSVNCIHENRINIFPNPSNGIFSIKSENKISFVKIMNVFGECIYKSLMLNAQSLIDLSSQPKGIYFIRINNESGNTTKKLIIQ